MKENNVRKGYVAQAVYERMADEAMKEGLWLRTLPEIAWTYGWRKSEMIGLFKNQLDLGSKPTMRLHDSKNGDGHVVPLMGNMLPLLKAMCEGKEPGDAVFTRDDGSVVKDFRGAWQNVHSGRSAFTRWHGEPLHVHQVQGADGSWSGNVPAD